jgi:hypothetical protein
MGVGIGRASYIAFGMQTAFRTVTTSLQTVAHQRQGSIFTHRSVLNPSSTTAQIMPRADQLWKTMGLVDFDVQLEYVANDTAFLPLLTAIWGKRIKTGGAPPYTQTYVMIDPFVDAGVDNTPAGSFWNHGLTIREIVHDGSADISPRVVQDVCINRAVFTMEANERLRYQLTGVGHKHLASTAPAFSQPTGTVAAWNHAYTTGSTGGVYVGVANPASTPLICKSHILTIDNNLLFEPALSTPSGEELHIPARGGWPSVSSEFELWAESGAAGTDMTDIFTDFLAETKQTMRSEYFIDANNSLEFIAGGTNDIGAIRDPKPVYAGEGKVGFSFGLDYYPIAAAGDGTDDIKMVQTAGA